MLSASDQTVRFLELLFASKQDGQFVQVWSIPTKRSEYCGSIAEAAATIELLKKAEDVYVAPGLAPAALSPSSRCPSEQIAGIPGVWADIDVRHGVHQSGALPPTLDAALTILPDGMMPSLLVSTGHGLHAYWLFPEIWTFEDADERAAAALLVARWQALLRRRAAANGWTLDHTHDLARVLRVPGTANLKDPNAVAIVRIYDETARRYQVSELEEALDESAIPKELGKRTTSISTDRFVLNPEAVVDKDLLAALLSADPKFRATWARQRWDLHNGDPSQSHYDLAIATFGLDIGLPEQVVVDLMIQHRREEGKASKLRPDYYARTLGRAYQRGAGSSPVRVVSQVLPAAPPLSPIEEIVASVAVDAPAASAPSADTQEAPAAASSPAGAPAPPPPAPKKEAKRELSQADLRALGIEEVSRLLNLEGETLLRLTKVTGKSPTYVLEFASGKVECPNVQTLMSQAKMRELLAAATNKMLPKFRAQDWDALVLLMLATLTEQDGGADLSLEGEMLDYLNQYLGETRFIVDTKGQTATAQRRPTIVDGQVAVMARDLEMWLRKSYGQTVSMKQISTALVAVGARNIRYRRGQLEQSRWALPTHEFPPARWVVEEMREEIA
jgi:hypothetical protein